MSANDVVDSRQKIVAIYDWDHGLRMDLFLIARGNHCILNFCFPCVNLSPCHISLLLQRSWSTWSVHSLFCPCLIPPLTVHNAAAVYVGGFRQTSHQSCQCKIDCGHRAPIDDKAGPDLNPAYPSRGCHSRTDSRGRASTGCEP